jgi:cell division protein FtsL
MAGGGVLWILVLGALLAGVVAVNVLVLQLNVSLDELGRERAGLMADNARLRSHLSSASANARIERQAAEQLGLVQADPAETTYVRIAGSGR